MKVFPLDPTKPTADAGPLFLHLGDAIESNINSYEKINIHSSLVILKVFCEENPAFLDRYIPILIKAHAVCSLIQNIS